MILAAITTYKRPPEMVERALKSVISQTYTDWKLVVVDDSPADYELRDDVRRMVEGYAEHDDRIRYVPHDKNYGANHARNTALNIAVNTYGGGFIAYLDDDDEWLPQKLEHQIAKFNECDENTAIVYCNAYHINNETKRSSEWIFLPYEGDDVHLKLLLERKNFIGSTSFPLIRTRCLAEIGGFDEKMQASQEYEMYIRLTERYKTAYINEPLIVYHEHNGEHIQGSFYKRLRASERIMQKYEKYFNANIPFYRLRIKNTLPLYLRAKEYRNFFKAWFKMVSLQPSKFFIDFWFMIKIMIEMLLPKWGIGKLKGLIYKKNPIYFMRMKFHYRKLHNKIFFWKEELKLIPTREQALDLLKQYNQEESHIHHAIAVEATMRHFAELYHEDPELWGIVGILHDIDWEKTTATPEKHCHLAPEILRNAGIDENIIHAVQSHGYGICTDVEPSNNLERTLFTIDELTGLIITAGLVRPSKSLADLELKSVKKKWKDKAFARGVNREIIKQGAEKMNMPLDDVITETIKALRPVEKLIGM